MAQAFATSPFQSPLVFDEGLWGRLTRALSMHGSANLKVVQRILFWVGIAWIPPLILGVIGALFSRESLSVNIFEDISFHVRCLVAIPILLGAEGRIQKEFDLLPRAIAKRRFFNQKKQELFLKCIAVIRSGQTSYLVDPLLYVFALLVVRYQIYYALPEETLSWRTAESLPYFFAQGWNTWISLPLYYFVVFRWVWRFLAWSLFLICTALLSPRLESLHPDRVGSLGFLLRLHKMFGVLVFSISAGAAANIAMLILHGNQSVDLFFDPFFIYLAIVGGTLAAPLFVFTPGLIKSRNRGLIRYSQFADHYASRFEFKWLTSSDAADKTSLGSPDIQSLNDLHGSYRSQTQMRATLLDMRTITVLAAFAAIPFVPLLLFKFPLVALIEMVARYFFKL